MSVQCAKLKSPKDEILERMRRGDLKGFTKALSFHGSKIAYSVYEHKSLLEEACRRGIPADFVHEILKVWDKEKYDDILGRSLRFAVTEGNVDAVNELLGTKRPKRKGRVADVNAVNCEGLTALHLLCKQPKTDEEYVSNLLKCLDVLLSVPELEVNRITLMGKTAIYIAADNRHGDIVKRLLQNKDTLIDVDTIDEGGAREKIRKNFPELIDKLNAKEKTPKTY